MRTQQKLSEDPKRSSQSASTQPAESQFDRVVGAGLSSRQNAVLRMQQTHGNQYVRRMIARSNANTIQRDDDGVGAGLDSLPSSSGPGAGLAVQDSPTAPVDSTSGPAPTGPGLAASDTPSVPAESTNGPGSAGGGSGPGLAEQNSPSVPADRVNAPESTSGPAPTGPGLAASDTPSAPAESTNGPAPTDGSGATNAMSGDVANAQMGGDASLWDRFTGGVSDIVHSLFGPSQKDLDDTYRRNGVRNPRGLPADGHILYQQGDITVMEGAGGRRLVYKYDKSTETWSLQG